MLKREYFSKIKETTHFPHIFEHHMQAFKNFLQMDTLPEKRKNIGLQEIFNEIFPILSVDSQYKLEFVSYSFNRPKYTVDECKRRSVSYAAPLRVRLRLLGPDNVIKEQEIYLGDIPLMTEVASFIINGDERVVVSQLQRSPGGVRWQ